MELGVQKQAFALLHIRHIRIFVYFACFVVNKHFYDD
ncbi:hypothetical protein U14_04421 [Candidatus Moduliflexus flocculans]|uniref:Uncharacterized protein n=1 Tax=Candidatus Moduliflexus flocculans TaxID=1499966 RepID=A0A0S6W484_9BACT|nr:hypothetical protein U14_04421 [Candidatus Moduliflexus flocculans]